MYTHTILGVFAIFGGKNKTKRKSEPIANCIRESISSKYD